MRADNIYALSKRTGINEGSLKQHQNNNKGNKMSFSDKQIVALREQSIGSGADTYEFLLQEDEYVELEYKSVRDMAIFTNKRMITIDVQGFTGSKVEFFCVSYGKVSAFSCETAGTFDLDSDFKVWISGLGLLQFEFLKGTDIKKLAKVLCRFV